MVIFIIGPYARKWFPHPQPISDRAEDELIRWILAPDAEDLHKQLNRVRSANRQTVIMAFFPFLPDGQESSELTLTQIADWQASFNALPLAESLPCIFGLYAQLSQERSVEDPDRAIWLGGFDVAARKETTLSKEFVALSEMLGQHSQHGDYHAIQRFAMADALQLWLRETGVMKSLQALFNQTSLKLTGVLLSDYGEGFVRHGAWANWIASRFEIYPGLASSMALPQIPDVLYKPGVITIIREAEKPRKKVCWLPIAVALLLGLTLAGTTWFEGQHLLKAKKSLEAFNNIDTIYLQQKRDAFGVLARENDSLKGCTASKFLQALGLSRCNRIRAEISNTISLYESSPILFSSGPVALFSLNSAELGEDSDESLKVLLPVVANNRQTTFMIVGHSDNTGSPELNMQLSEKRAKAVRDWLVKHADVPLTNFMIKGAGDTAPIASNETEEGRKQNRRVDLIPIPANQHTNDE
ncbi:OmpA family protein [Pantoea sp. BAV 3049]|uniref:OmpA family protein n=1 Tax=Pantoea sp. BAV 3049 TaxID=2654188 RepID=UPI00131D4BFD|nr:OmpA family protein [Pantoea sp. BAV 3049]